MHHVALAISWKRTPFGGKMRVRREGAMPQITISDRDGDILREVLDAKLIELRREISHTDSPRFRQTLNEVEAMLERVIPQLPRDATAT